MLSDNLRDKGLILLGIVAMTATLLGVVAVISRYAFSATFSFSDEVVTYLIVWGTLIAFGLGECLNEHLRATVLLERLSSAWQTALTRLTLALGLLFGALLIYFGVEVAWHRFQFNEVSPTILQFPQWIARAAVPVGFVIACLGLLARCKHKEHRSQP